MIRVGWWPAESVQLESGEALEELRHIPTSAYLLDVLLGGNSSSFQSSDRLDQLVGVSRAELEGELVVAALQLGRCPVRWPFNYGVWLDGALLAVPGAQQLSLSTRPIRLSGTGN